MKKSRNARSVLLFQNFSCFVDPLDKRSYEAALLLYEAMDTPISLSMYIKLKYGEWRQIAESKISPISYEKSWAFERDYQAVSFLSKYPYLDSGVDRQAVALDAFREAEEECAQTNQRFRNMDDSPLNVEGDVRTVLWLAGRKIQHILGDLDWDEFARSTGWGPGATNVAKGHYTSSYNKFSGPLSSTIGNLTLGLCCINSTPTWAHWQSNGNSNDFESSIPTTLLKSSVTVSEGGEIIFVPKNAKTDRTITIPVHLNSYVQKGFGKMIRRRLKQAGIDLNDQSPNQHHALLGSRYNDRATLDAKAASDTIATGLVRHLLPEEWFDALYNAREPKGYLKKEKVWISFQKFSSMGNSFTFELESLIFYALCQACVEASSEGRVLINKWTGHAYPDAVSVFGDDMVVPVDCYPLVLKVLSFAGFTLNLSKTYVEGEFRESCGKDYFHGNLVRPVFLKERLQNAEAVFKLANNVRRLAHRRMSYDGCDVTLRAVWLHLTSILPEHQRRLRISEGYGDGGFVSNWDEARPSRPRERSHEGWRMKALLHTPVKERMHQYGPAMASYLTGTDEPPSVDGYGRCYVSNRDYALKVKKTKDAPVKDGEFDLRGQTRQKVATVVVPEWYDMGPWR